MSNKWTVGYDGPSRPIILGPKYQMYSISKFINGSWQAFSDEPQVCQLLCDELNEVGFQGETEDE